jgi:hypothetical protein
LIALRNKLPVAETGHHLRPAKTRFAEPQRILGLAAFLYLFPKFRIDFDQFGSTLLYPPFQTNIGFL